MDVGQPKDFLSGMLQDRSVCLVLIQRTGTCLYLSHLTSQHSPLLSDPSKNKWVYGGNVLVDPVGLTAWTVAKTNFGLSRPPRSTPQLCLGQTLLLGQVSKSGPVFVCNVV